MAKTRAEILHNSNKEYDIIIIGGGVIGATIALKTSRVGLSALLLRFFFQNFKDAYRRI